MSLLSEGAGIFGEAAIALDPALKAAASSAPVPRPILQAWDALPPATHLASAVSSVLYGTAGTGAAASLIPGVGVVAAVASYQELTAPAHPPGQPLPPSQRLAPTAPGVFP